MWWNLKGLASVMAVTAVIVLPAQIWDLVHTRAVIFSDPL